MTSSIDSVFCTRFLNCFNNFFHGKKCQNTRIKIEQNDIFVFSRISSFSSCLVQNTSFTKSMGRGRSSENWNVRFEFGSKTNELVTQPNISLYSWISLRRWRPFFFAVLTYEGKVLKVFEECCRIVKNTTTMDRSIVWHGL